MFRCLIPTTLGAHLFYVSGAVMLIAHMEGMPPAPLGPDSRALDIQVLGVLLPSASGKDWADHAPGFYLPLIVGLSAGNLCLVASAGRRVLTPR